MDINNLTKTGNKKALWLASITGDIFSLGGHWIYDVDKLAASFPIYDKPQAPPADTFHKNKKLGDMTHYGDQAYHLWQYLAANDGKYEAAAYRAAWLDYMNNYSGYMDKASKESLLALKNKQEFGSSSQELGGTARIAAVYYWIEDPAAALFAALDQNKMTHNSEAATAVTYLIAQSLQSLLDATDSSKLSVFAVLEEVSAQMQNDDKYESRLIVDSFTKAKKLQDLSAGSIAKELGQSCQASQSLPALLAVLKATEDYQKAMALNVMVGGDSANRAMIIGSLLGARSGIEVIPSDWYLF